MNEPDVPVYRRLRTPRAAAIAGVLLLFATSLILLRTALDADPSVPIAWNGPAGARVRIAMTLMPFTRIAFLWFIGVVRDRLGDLEDRFFSTVTLGSVLLFVALVFTSMSMVGGLLAKAFADLAVDAERGLTAFGSCVDAHDRQPEPVGDPAPFVGAGGQHLCPGQAR